MLTQFQLNHNFFEAAMYDDLAKMKLIMTSTGDMKPDIHFYNDGALTLACSNGNLEMVKFLLTSPDLTEHAYLHSDHYQAFKAACIEEHFHILEYLVFEYNMKMDEAVECYLDKPDFILGKTVKSMFEKREISKKLHHELKNELQPTKSISKALKV